jgi:hypothetical protein
MHHIQWDILVGFMILLQLLIENIKLHEKFDPDVKKKSSK